MAENDRPLPTPPRTRFGRQLRGEEEGGGGLAADRLMQAAAEGRLEEVLQHEIPKGEHARNLAMMMLGMSGMTARGTPGPAAGAPGTPEEIPSAPDLPGGAGLPGGSGSAVPPEVLAATMQGDVAGLTALLRAEHERRGGGATGSGAPDEAAAPAVTGVGAAQRAAADASAARPGIDQALIDELIRVGVENQVTVDWLLLRAVKLYLEEHRRTGRL